MQKIDANLAAKLPQATSQPQAQKAQRVNRMIAINAGLTEITISFYWRERTEHSLTDLLDTTFSYPLSMDLEGVERGINHFLANGAKLALEHNGVIICSQFIDYLHEDFDMIADAEEPQQVLVSKYIQ